jgi:hypothetical protein
MTKQKNRFEFGQDLVEFAITLPLLFMMLVGIFDLGRVVYYYSALTNTAREGARTGIIYENDNTDIEAAICHYGVGLDIGCPNPSMTAVKINLEPDGNDTVDHIRVTMTYQFKPVTPLIGRFFGIGETDTIPLSSQATMRLEY